MGGYCALGLFVVFCSLDYIEAAVDCLKENDAHELVREGQTGE